MAEVAEVAEMCTDFRPLPPAFTDFRPLPPAFTDFGYLRHLRYLRNLRVLHIPIPFYIIHYYRPGKLKSDIVLIFPTEITCLATVAEHSYSFYGIKHPYLCKFLQKGTETLID